MRAVREHWEGFVADVKAGGSVAADPRYWGLVLLIVAKQFERVNYRSGDSAC